jgi:lysophospholipase L1-like esterase
MTNRKASLQMLRTANPAIKSKPRAVMATPPTVLMSAANTNSLAAGRFWPAITAQNGVGANTSVYGPFTYSGAAAIVQQTTYAGVVFFTNVSFGGVTNHGGGANGKKFNQATISFMYYGTQFNIGMVGNGSQATFCVKVDDEYVSLTPVNVPTAGNFYYYNVTFAAAAWRRIDIVANQFLLFTGVYTGLTDSVQRCDLRGPRVVMVGDSLTEGSGALNGGGSSLAQRAMEALGWDNFIQSGVGGTGLLQTLGSSTNYRGRFSADVLPYLPDVVVVQGSTNDSSGGFTPTQMGDEVTQIVQTLKLALPNVIVVVTSQVAVNGPTGTTNISWLHKAAMKAACIAAGGHWIDLLELPLPVGHTPTVHTLTNSPIVGALTFTVSGATPPAVGGTFAFPDGTRVLVKSVSGTAAPYTVTIEAGGLQTAQTTGFVMTQVGDCPWSGTGRVGATTGDGNSDVLVQNDHVHPTQAGHDMAGQIIAEGLQSILRVA